MSENTSIPTITGMSIYIPLRNFDHWQKYIQKWEIFHVIKTQHQSATDWSNFNVQNFFRQFDAFLPGFFYYQLAWSQWSMLERTVKSRCIYICSVFKRYGIHQTFSCFILPFDLRITYYMMFFFYSSKFGNGSACRYTELNFFIPLYTLCRYMWINILRYSVLFAFLAIHTNDDHHLISHFFFLSLRRIFDQNNDFINSYMCKIYHFFCV